MGIQAKYYQVKSNSIQIAIEQLSVDEDYYNTINDTNLINSSIDIDKSFTFLSELIENLSNKSELSKLAFYGLQIDAKDNHQCEVQYISNNLVSEIATILFNTRIFNKNKFSHRFNLSQENAYDILIYANFYHYYWIHYNSIVEFYIKCKDENSAILVLID